MEFLGESSRRILSPSRCNYLAPDYHRVKSGFWVAYLAQKSLGGRASRDVLSNIAFEVALKESLDDFGRGYYGGLVGFFRAFVIKAYHAFDESAGDQNERSFRVVRTSEDDDSVVE